MFSGNIWQSFFLACKLNDNDITDADMSPAACLMKAAVTTTNGTVEFMHYILLARKLR